MVKAKRAGITAERYIEATLDLIAERGGSSQVNLREVSRRIGCAHTNAYNYFAGLEDLMLAALRRALRLYADAMADGLDDSLSGHAWFQRMVRNMFSWSIENPGLHRFISSDPLDPEQLPADIIDAVITMKRWLLDALRVVAGDRLDADEAATLLDVMLGYLDGEVFNLINGRVLPGEDIAGRVLGNLERLFTLLTAKTSDGISLAVEHAEPGQLRFPKLEVAL